MKEKKIAERIENKLNDIFWMLIVIAGLLIGGILLK